MIKSPITLGRSDYKVIRDWKGLTRISTTLSECQIKEKIISCVHSQIKMWLDGRKVTSPKRNFWKKVLFKVSPRLRKFLARFLLIY